MREAVIVASSRTGLAKAGRGSFNITRPEDLAAHCVKDVIYALGFKRTHEAVQMSLPIVDWRCAQ